MVGRPLFIPIKVGQWCMKPKMTDFPGLKVPGSEAVLAHRVAHRVSTLETLLLRWCVTSVEPTSSSLALR